MAKHILTPNGDPMDYKVVKLKPKKVEDKDKKTKKKKKASKK